MANNGQQSTSSSSNKRPAMISELAEAARNTQWDENGSVKYFLRLAERGRREGQAYFEQKDLENSFIAFARAASLILEKIPNHREYKTLLTSAQRENLAQNGQEILDNLGQLKPVLVDRYEKWVKHHGSNQQNTKAMDPMNMEALSQEVERQLKDEAESWKRQREEASRQLAEDRLDPPFSARRKDDEYNHNRPTFVTEPSYGSSFPNPGPLQADYANRHSTPSGIRDQTSVTGSQYTFTSPSPSQGPSTASPAHLSSGRSYGFTMESPTKGSEDYLGTIDPSRDRRRAKPSRYLDEEQSTLPSHIPKSPVYPIPVTTTSPPPLEGSRIDYPQLMSHHQRTQGYIPSLNSMFTPPSAQSISPSLFFTSPPSAPASQSLYSSNLLPRPPASTETPQQSHPIPYHRSESTSTTTPVKHAQPGPNVSSKSRQDSYQPELKMVNLPRDCLQRFLVIAKVNTSMNRETCGLLLGKDKGTKFAVTTLLIPKQHSTSDTCTMDEEELVLQFTEQRNLITLGWIHTHPSQSCFMSSVDLHTHSGFQRMLPESFAVVCAPKSNPNFGIFRLTDPPGLQTILKCEAKEAFHPHPDIPIYTDADKGHVQMKDLPLEIVDLR